MVVNYGIPISPPLCNEGGTCQGLTKKLTVCKKQALSGSMYCPTHRPMYGLECPSTCAICTNDMSPSTVRPTKCGHYMHAECLAEWLAGHTTCPMCRTELREDIMSYFSSPEIILHYLLGL